MPEVRLEYGPATTSGLQIPWTAPRGVTEVTVELQGARGGGRDPLDSGRVWVAGDSPRPGFGGKVICTIPVEEGETYYITLGAPGSAALQSFNLGTYGLFGGGGAYNPDSTGTAAGKGGGGTAFGPTSSTSTVAWVHAGGGGGMTAGLTLAAKARGGDGGGPNGQTGGNLGGTVLGGGGATQAAGGAAGTGGSGAQYQAPIAGGPTGGGFAGYRNSTARSGGGGGGGRFGGGGGASVVSSDTGLKGGGGGGSSWADPGVCTSITYELGTNAGGGTAVLVYDEPPAPVPGNANAAVFGLVQYPVPSQVDKDPMFGPRAVYDPNTDRIYCVSASFVVDRFQQSNKSFTNPLIRVNPATNAMDVAMYGWTPNLSVPTPSYGGSITVGFMSVNLGGDGLLYSSNCYYGPPTWYDPVNLTSGPIPGTWTSGATTLSAGLATPPYGELGVYNGLAVTGVDGRIYCPPAGIFDGGLSPLFGSRVGSNGFGQSCIIDTVATSPGTASWSDNPANWTLFPRGWSMKDPTGTSAPEWVVMPAWAQYNGSSPYQAVAVYHVGLGAFQGGVDIAPPSQVWVDATESFYAHGIFFCGSDHRRIMRVGGVFNTDSWVLGYHPQRFGGIAESWSGKMYCVPAPYGGTTNNSVLEFEAANPVASQRTIPIPGGLLNANEGWGEAIATEDGCVYAAPAWTGPGVVGRVLRIKPGGEVEYLTMPGVVDRGHTWLWYRASNLYGEPVHVPQHKKVFWPALYATQSLMLDYNYSTLSLTGKHLSFSRGPRGGPG